jgi:hypothetical protein
MASDEKIGVKMVEVVASAKRGFKEALENYTIE